MVPERRLRQRLLDPADRAGRACSSRPWSSRSSSSSATCGWPAGSAAAARPAAAADRSARCSTGSTRPPRRPTGPAHVVGGRRLARRRSRDADHLRRRRPARPDADRRLDPGAVARPHRAGHRRRRCRQRGRRSCSGRTASRSRRHRERGHRPDLQPRHRLLPVRAAVPAPRPGRVQRHRRGDARARPSPATSWARRVAASCSRRPVRVHLAVLGGLFLLSVAFGYQLDKLELVYSNRGIATGVSFTDQNAQFFAYDVLTVVSGIAAALLVGGGVHADDLAARADRSRVWFLASLVIGRLYPEAVQRFTVEPEPVRPGRALHRQQHRDDAARLRPRRVGRQPSVRWRGRPHPGRHRGRGRHVHQRPAVGLPPAARRRSTSSRRSAATTTSPTSTPTAT